MKQTPPTHRNLQIHAAPKGAALVIVLGVLVLLLAIVVGFLSRVAVERSSAASYSHAAAAARLSEASVQLVQAQIEYASTRGNGSLWVSQPGMVRTFDLTGNQTSYKLYSARQMAATDNGTTLLSADAPPTGWASSPAEWVDLNAPVVSGTDRYFPILNPGAIGHVPGFSVNASWVTPTTLPMPVRWLYVLAGGEIIAPSSSSGNSVSFNGTNAPTTANPIVGRIAFWTDDESAKVNVNTAGAPTFFDLPWYATDQEKQLADSQPARSEFQRYPGHPATVDLAAVLTPLLTAKGLTQRQIQDATLDLAPRLDAGGSLYATKSVTAKQIMPINITSQRLYASEDEILYDPDREANSHLTNSDVDLLKFFLTAHSRAPELNPFNLPKVATWPLHSTNNATHRTSYEYLINRAASINDKPYFFQRANSQSPTADWVDIPRNQELFAYLNSLFSQPLPGLGLSLESKFQDDQPQILAEILDYIRSTNLYDDLIPEANRFTRKTSKTLGPDKGHGFVAPLQVKPPDGKTYQGFGRFYTLSELAFLFICNADGYDRNNDGINDNINVNNGTDTDYDVNDPAPYPWVGNASVSPDYQNYERRRSRYGRGYAGVRDPTSAPDNFNVPNGTMLPADQRIVQMMILPELFSPMYGYGILRADMRIEISGLGSMTLNGQPLFPHASEIVEVTASYEALEKCWPLGGAGDFRQALVYTVAKNNHSVKGLPARGGIVADAAATSVETTYPLVSNPVTITVGSPPPANATMSFITGCLTVKISYGSGANATLVQTIHLPAKSADIPVPNLVAYPDIKSETETATWWGFHADGVATANGTKVPGRLAYTSGNVDSPGRAGMLVRGTSSLQKLGLPIYTNEHKSVINTDVVRSFVPKHGDFRLVATQPEVASDVFVPLGDWSSGNFAQSTLHMADWTASRVASAVDSLGKYRAAVVNYGGKNITSTAIGATNPDFPLEASTDPNRNPNVSGDYDKGVSYGLDGPYINKPDEGNIYGSPGDIPYFFNTRPEYHEFDGTRFFSPNRVIPSPGMFGSLPTHVLRGRPWRTLLFRPQQNHPNWSDPKDHLLMEFFWMPVVEPYAISEPFSTAGKINMNYQIMPFTWITRSTGLHAALSEERVTAVPTEDAPYYNSIMNFNPLAGSQFRLRIDADKTLGQFTDVFNAGNVFRSASEICDLYLVPAGETLAGMGAFWTNHDLTSDNVRERVYTTLYPKLTVRSNIYTVHYKVQALRKRPGSPAATWTEGVDQVVGESRGYTTIERFLDPNNTSIPDYASSAAPYNETSASEFYHWRTIRNVPFAP